MLEYCFCDICDFCMCDVLFAMNLLTCVFFPHQKTMPLYDPEDESILIIQDETRKKIVEPIFSIKGTEVKVGDNILDLVVLLIVITVQRPKWWKLKGISPQNAVNPICNDRDHWVFLLKRYMHGWLSKLVCNKDSDFSNFFRSLRNNWRRRRIFKWFLWGICSLGIEVFKKFVCSNITFTIVTAEEYHKYTLPFARFQWHSVMPNSLQLSILGQLCFFMGLCFIFILVSSDNALNIDGAKAICPLLEKCLTLSEL